MIRRKVNSKRDYLMVPANMFGPMEITTKATGEKGKNMEKAFNI